MSDINKEIDELATDLAKSQKTPKEILFDTILALGPEGVRAKLPTLEKSEQELLKGALEEMKKAVSMDKDYAAKYVQGEVDKTKIQEDKADDDQDEKLVKPEAAKMNNQGTPTDGWEGQVIKGDKMSKDKAKDKLMEMEEKEHGTKDPKKLVDAEKKEHAKKDMEKAHVGFKAVEEKAKEEGAEDPKAVAAAVGIKKYGKEGMEAKAQAGKMKKGDEMDEKLMKDAKKKVKSGDKDQMKEGLKEMKKALELSMPDASPELIKGEMKRMLAEEDQDGDAPEMNEATRAKKESVPAIELGKDNKKNMTKSADWTQENALLKAMTGGRNHHFSMEEYINEVLAAASKPEEVQKSQNDKKEDLNDIIAKGGDANWDHVNTDRLLKANKEKITGKMVKSFQDNEIAQALGLTEEEAKKILGE